MFEASFKRFKKPKRKKQERKRERERKHKRKLFKEFFFCIGSFVFQHHLSDQHHPSGLLGKCRSAKVGTDGCV